MPEVEEVDGSLSGRPPGLWGPSSPALAPSGRRMGARGPFAGWRALWWACWGEALATLQEEFSGVPCAPVGLVLEADASDGLDAVELQGVALSVVWCAAALVELFLAVPLHPELHPTLWARVLEVVLDCALTPDPVTGVVVAERLLDSCAFLQMLVRFGLGRCLWREGGQ